MIAKPMQFIASLQIKTIYFNHIAVICHTSTLAALHYKNMCFRLTTKPVSTACSCWNMYKVVKSNKSNHTTRTKYLKKKAELGTNKKTHATFW